jgi:GDP-4-dehydro-6-deoxy-D-mannose reductase
MASGGSCLRVLITGITGMAGSHLADYLLERGDVEIFGTVRWRSRMDNLAQVEASGRLNALEGLNIPDQETLARYLRPGAANLLECDLCDATSTRQVIEAVRPDRIFHLAAQSFVPTSWHAPAHTLQTNVLGQLNLLEAVRQAGISPRIHIAGSSEQYGLVREDEVPIRETNPLRPLSPYAVSKVAQEMMAYQYHKSYGFHTVVSRAFNHTGPRRGQVLASSSFAKQIAEIEARLKDPVIDVGDLTARRDWSDVRDIVRAYWLALEHCEPGEAYNIGSDNAIGVGEMLQLLLGHSTAHIETRVDASRLRPSDVKLLWSDSTKFRQATGWSPTIPFTQTMRDLLDYWRDRIAQQKHSSATPAH